MNKIEKIRDVVERRMYSHNLQADLAVSEEMFDEKVSDAKYEECKEILSAIDAIKKDNRYSVWCGADEEPQEKREDIGIILNKLTVGEQELLWRHIERVKALEREDVKKKYL